jgi:hypothetical protein
MEARLYELIRDYQVDRAAAIGGPVAAFHADALRRFAQRRPERYPEYFVEAGRLSRAIERARREGEILPSPTNSRDEPLVLRVDLDRGR